jgi:hypothetical protein
MMFQRVYHSGITRDANQAIVSSDKQCLGVVEHIGARGSNYDCTGQHLRRHCLHIRIPFRDIP